MNVAIVVAAVVGLATVAFAVAGTSREPRAADVPIMVTSRPATTAVIAVDSNNGSLPTSSAVNPTKSASSTASASSAHQKSGGSSSQSSTMSSSSGKKSTGVGKKSGGSSAKSRTNTSDSGDSVEIIKPLVHDEGSDGSSERNGSDGSATGD